MEFDAIAPYYDRLSRLVFGKSLMKAQLNFLHKIQPYSTVLVLGGGTGWWLTNLLQQQPTCKVTYLDPSAEMLRLAEKSTNNDQRITFIQGTHELLPLDRKFDIIIAFCFLDIFSNENLKPVLGKLVVSVHPKGLLLVTDFVNARWWHGVMLFTMYWFFKFVSGLDNQRLPDWEKMLLRFDLREVDRKYYYGSFIKTAMYTSVKI